MTIIKLKQYIYKNQKIEFILSQLGCHHIKYHISKNYFSCANPDGDNIHAVQVFNNEYLHVKNYTRNIDKEADLISLVQFYKKLSFYKALQYLHRILKLKMEYNKSDKINDIVDPLAIFKKVQLRKRRCNVNDLEVLDESILKDFVPYIHIKWFKEGIMPWTVSRFGLGYSFEKKRIIIPHRYWQDGSLVGIMGRTTIENYQELGIPKYFPIKEYSKSQNLYGLWENYNTIQQLGYVVVYESEKSVLKRDSLNDCTGVALGCHSLSDEQIRILIGLNVDIIIAMDKDIEIEEVEFLCSHFKGIRNTYYIYDKYDLIKGKDSPADMSNKLFNFMMKYKIKYC